MKRIVRLTESDLTRIVRRVINEGAYILLPLSQAFKRDDVDELIGKPIHIEYDNIFGEVIVVNGKRYGNYEVVGNTGNSNPTWEGAKYEIEDIDKDSMTIYTVQGVDFRATK